MKLVLMGDLHFSRMENGTEEMYTAREKVYSALIDTFWEIDADYHISLGDLTHEGYPEEFHDVLNRMNSSRNFIHVLGNHDTLAIPKSDILTVTGQQRYQAIDTDEANLIFLDTTKEMNHGDWGGEIEADQLHWLQFQLEKSNKPVFVFAHHPVYDTTARSIIDKLSIHPDIGMKKLLNKREGAGFYFCGHKHVNSIVQQDGWHYIQIAACLDVSAFRVVEIKDGQVNINMISIDDETLMEQIAIVNTKIPGFVPIEQPHGEESDRNVLVEIQEPVTEAGKVFRKSSRSAVGQEMSSDIYKFNV